MLVFVLSVIIIIIIIIIIFCNAWQYFLCDFMRRLASVTVSLLLWYVSTLSGVARVIPAVECCALSIVVQPVVSIHYYRRLQLYSVYVNTIWYALVLAMYYPPALTPSPASGRAQAPRCWDPNLGLPQLFSPAAQLRHWLEQLPFPSERIA